MGLGRKLFEGTLWQRNAALILDSLFADPSWTPTYGTQAGVLSGQATTTAEARYLTDSDLVAERLLWFSLHFATALGTSASNYLTFTLPATNALAGLQSIECDLRIDSGSYERGTCWFTGSSTTVQVYRSTFLNFPITTASNKHEIRVTGTVLVT